MGFALSLLAIALFAAAAMTDMRHRRIPNRLSIALALLGLLRIAIALAGGVGLVSAGIDLAVTLAVFALGACAFRFGLIGGGDVKLLAAGALWLGSGALGPYLLTTVLSGGLLAVLFVGWQLALPGGRRRRAPTLPYAVAIAAGGILTTAGGILATTGTVWGA